MNNHLKILMPAAEIAPFAKVGGLADVAGSLPPALKKLGCDVRLIMPLYGSVNRKKYKLKKIHSNIEITAGALKRHIVKINLWQAKLPNGGAIVYFIETAKYFKNKQIYADNNNAERFLFFSSATLQVLPTIKFKPDIIHCHDFHTALIPDMLKVIRQAPGFNPVAECARNAKTIFTIHNLNFQGKTGIKTLSTGNLTKDSLKSLSKDARDGDINFMVQGILNADAVTTVSKTYAEEIATSFYGASLDKIIKKRKNDLYGIVNGIDICFFNPAADKFIKQKYSIKSLDKKAGNKLALQKKLGWPRYKNIALIGLVSRLFWQKGLELIDKTLIEALKRSSLPCQFVILGSGQAEYEKQLKNLGRKYPEMFKARIGFDAKLAQEIYAACDIFLMPSRFEPCGLGQMIAMRYGAVPVVRHTGGLADTVVNFPYTVSQLKFNLPTKATGFSFKQFNADMLFNTLKKALEIYYQRPKKWRKLQINGMKQDFSWNNSAEQYLKLYNNLHLRDK